LSLDHLLAHIPQVRSTKEIIFLAGRAEELEDLDTLRGEV
jgi:hypothetical protein